VALVERDAAASQALEKNRQTLGAAAIEIIRADAVTWLAGNRTAWNLIFLDPPFDSGLAASILPELGAHLAPGGLVYVEQGAEITVPAWPRLRSAEAFLATRSGFVLALRRTAG